MPPDCDDPGGIADGLVAHHGGTGLAVKRRLVLRSGDG